MRKIFCRNFINIFFELLYFLILIRLLFSFLPVEMAYLPFFNKLLRFIYQVTEPVLTPFRNLIPSFRAGGGVYLDFSPVLALLVLSLLRRFLLGLFS